MIEKKLVELGASDLIGSIASRIESVFKIELYLSSGTCRHDLTAMLRHKCSIKFFAHTKSIKSLRAKRKKRFTNVKARKFFALEHDDTSPRFSQQGGCRTPGWTATNDCYVIHRLKAC